MGERINRIVDKARQWLLQENQRDLQFLREKADVWRYPSGSEYIADIARRRAYLDGDMHADGFDLLKQEFEKSYKHMDYKMVQYAIAQFIWEARAKVFEGRGSRFYLKDRNGEEVDSKAEVAKSFAEMHARAGTDLVLNEIDTALEAHRNCAGKVWWNRDRLEVSEWDPDQVHIGINPAREWDPYAAYGVLFEREGEGGVNSDPRYEVWAASDHNRGKNNDESGKIYYPDMHYISTAQGSVSVNDKDQNPFKDRHTGKPMYPFTWFQMRKEAVYWKGGDDLVRLNRVVNLGMTYLHHNMIWQMAVIPAFEAQPGQSDKETLAKLKQIVFATPNKALTVPPGVTFNFKTPQGNVGPFTDVYQMLVQYMALLKKLPAKLVDIKGGLPPSGIALEIELDGLIRYTGKKTKILRPQVRDLQDKMIVVWNYHQRDHGYALIPDDLIPEWDPGHFDTGPVDHVAINNRYREECEFGISNYYEWHAAAKGVDLKTAEEQVKNNLEINAGINQAMTRYPSEVDKKETDEKVDDLVDKDSKEPKQKKADNTGGVEDATADKIVANVYQIVKAIEVGAATPVDLRMMLWPHETREQAEQAVLDSLDFNKEHAAAVAEAKAIEEGMLAKAKKGGAAPAQAGDQEPTDKQKKADQELNKFVKGGEDETDTD